MTYYLPRTRVRRAAMWAAAVALTLAALAAPAPRAHSAEDVAAGVAAQRIVSIGGSVTEIVYALGEGGRLAGRDSTSIYPHAALALPDIGYMRAISPEGVLAISPDAILSIEGSGPPEAIEVLKKASIPFAQVPEGFSEAGILEKIRAVGAALGVPDKAEALCDAVKADIDAAIAATNGISERKRVLFILSMQGDRVLAAGTDTAADGIIAMAGGINAVVGYAGYKPLTDEAIITARPDVILMMDNQGNHALGNGDLKAHAALSQTPAMQNDAVVRMDGAYLLGFGPRTASAARDLAKALYGDRVVN